MTVLAFAAVFAELGLGSVDQNYLSASLVALGVFLGSVGWWPLLSSGVSLFRRNLTTTGLRWVNRLVGAIIITFGVIAIVGMVLARK